MKVLVTGGTGFVGSHLVPRLRSEGSDVRVLGREADPVPPGVEMIEGSVVDLAAVRKAVDGVDAVVHLVAIIVERGLQT
jgi:dihydroflavonol-4-reductase